MKKIAICLCVLSLMLVSFTAGVEYQRGDVSQDGNVDIEDVTTLISYLLNGTWPAEDQPVTETFTVNGVSFKMITVEGGTFTMGATYDETDDPDLDGEAIYNAKPVHDVSVSSFSIGETEVTQALWLAVMGANPSYFSPRSGYAQNLERPVETVSWDACQSFITKLNELTGRNFRLPTEAEWEYAARGGNRSMDYIYSGSNDINEVAWYFYNLPSQQWGSEECSTRQVATKKANELSLYDMSGNVYEWVQDWYMYGYSDEAQSNPTGPESGYSRVTRGGSFDNRAIWCRVSARMGNNPQYGVNNVGLRLAL